MGLDQAVVELGVSDAYAILAPSSCVVVEWIEKELIASDTETEMDVGGEAHQGGVFFFFFFYDGMTGVLYTFMIYSF